MNISNTHSFDLEFSFFFLLVYFHYENPLEQYQYYHTTQAELSEILQTVHQSVDIQMRKHDIQYNNICMYIVRL